MKKLILFLALLTCVRSYGQTPLIKATGASPLAYADFLQNHPQYISFTDYSYRRLQKNESQEQKFFKLSDSFEQNVELALWHLKGLQQEGPLTLTSLRFLRDLTDKELTKKKSKTTEAALKQSHCKALVLLQEDPIGNECAVQFISSKALQRRFPQIEKIALETVLHSVVTETSIAVAAQTPYQWTLLSDDHLPVSFYGTYEQLLQQNFSFSEVVSGDCRGFVTNTDLFSALQPAQIYFSESCTKRSHEMPEPPSWTERNKPWLYVAGAAALGLLAYSMKDKTLVIDSAGFK